MAFEDFTLLSRRERVRLVLLVVALCAVIVWATLYFLEPGPPRRVVIASGAEFGLYHQYAQRYKEILRVQGVTVIERTTGGASENLRLIADPKSGVDVAFMQGGVAGPPESDQLVMLASLYYEPLWIFYRNEATLTEISQLRGKRLAVGLPGSGARALADQLLALNDFTVGEGGEGVTQVLPLGGNQAIDALKEGRVDAVLYVGGAQTPLVLAALRDPEIKLMSVERAEAYARRLPFISRLTLPRGTIDFGLDVPPRDVQLIGTKAMLVAREGLHPALVNLLIDAAREVHGGQGYFEAAGEFPGTTPVDLPVSADADQHRRFGPSFLYRYLPYWLAAIVERAIVIVLPLAVVLVPVLNFLPQIVRARVKARVYRWYAELETLERDVVTREKDLPIAKWLHELDLIERAAERIHMPAKFASEAYTLREHIALVRRTILARAGSASVPEK